MAVETLSMVARERNGNDQGGSGPTDPRFDLWFRRLVRSDEEAFEALFRATYDGLLSVAERITLDSGAAHDVVQDAFVRLWRRRAEHDPSGSVRSLLYRTVRNLALNHVRDRKRREVLLAERLESAAPTDRSPFEDPAESRAAADRLETWIEQLPERQKQAITLSRFHGLSHREIAEVMDVAPRTVNNHLVRGLRTLRDLAVTHGMLPGEANHL